MKKFILILITLVLVTACGTDTEIFPPEAIQAGVDRCEVCNMLVPDDYNATQLVLNDGRSLKFDDLGCMVDWVRENGMETVNVRYVRDYHTEEWLVMENATFVFHKEFRTPMAYGVYSFNKKEEAETFLREQGKGTMLSYDDLEGHPWERDMEMMKKLKEEMGHDDNEQNEKNHESDQ